jgi:branched-chain amino acid transport system ATP-binding protein
MMLEAKNLVKDFDGLRAVDDVSLTVPQGTIVGLIGPNGSGKSTLLSMIARTLDVTAGQIVFGGDDLTHQSAEAAFRLGLVRSYQDPALFFQMTVLDNALLPVKDQRGEQPWYAPWRRFWQQQERANAGLATSVLKQVNLHPHFDKPAADLSGGQMKLLELARSLMGQPKLLLLDEPTAGVASTLAYEIFQQIDTLRREARMTFLIVEHRLEILFDFVDTVYVMHMGKVLAHGTPDEIAQNVDVREVYFGD